MVNRASQTPTDVGPLAVRAERRSRAALLKFTAENSTVLVVVLLLVFFGLTSQNFVSPNNIFNIWRQMMVVAIVSIGMTMVILIGGIDLSVGSVVFLSSGIMAVLLKDNVPTPLAILAGLLAGAGVGLLNGLVVEVAGISPVIATLGTLIGLRGLGQVVMSNAQVRVTDPFFEWIATQRTPGITAINLPGLPVMVVVMGVLYLIAAILMRQSRFGRYVYAIGGNQTAVRLSGVPVIRYKVLVYTLCGLCSGVGGMMIAASLGVIGPNVGSGREFYAVAAVVLGGTRLSGGVGRVEKTLLGAMILYMVLNYMTLRHIPDIWQDTTTGLLVLAAVLLDQLARRSQERG